MLNPIESSYKASDGSKVFVQYWKPEAVKAVVIQVHGLGEHSGRYQHVADTLAENGIALLAYDHVGHGKSGGIRGHIPSYVQLMDEVDLAMAKARAVFGEAPIILYGHSWGGNIALNFILRRKPSIQAAIITSPWLKLPTEPPAIQVFLGGLMKNIWPSFTQNTNLDHNLLTHDPAVNQAYKTDPLVHGKISALNFFESDAAAKYALQRASSYSNPTLFMHGTADGITDVEGTKQFSSKATNAKFIPWEGLYHEIHNETSHQDLVKKEMTDFIASVL